jgi:hypothetical protein
MRLSIFFIGLLGGIVCFAVVGFAQPLAITLPFYDVSTTHLPGVFLSGQSKDARPVDIDGDGDLDLIIAHEYRPNILLVNDGTGRFSNESHVRIPQFNRDSEDVAAGDFDQDGDMDIVIANEDNQVNELYFNNGEGIFTDRTPLLPVTGVSNAVIVSDINKDGAPDLLFGDTGQTKILINRGDGTFVNETEGRLPALTDITQDLELGDVDGDGDLDLLVANEGDNRLLINDGTGRFESEGRLRLPGREIGEETREADFGDVDGDGDLDIYFANVNFRRTGDSQNRLLINDGRGAFSDETARRLPPNMDYTMDADFVDIDGDGDLDVITAGLVIRQGLAPTPYRVYLNDGTGVFLEATKEFFPKSAFGVGTDIEAADFNGDGQLDFYLADRAGPDHLLFGR